MDLAELVKNLSTEQKKLLVKLCSESKNTTLNNTSNNHHCPNCGSDKVSKNGHNKDCQKFVCRDCKKFYSITTKTLFHYSKKSIDLWQSYIELMIEGYSLRKIANELDINLKTAFYWRHKILDTLNKKLAIKLDGIVEADETYFNKSDKGNKKLDRTPRKRGGKSKSDTTNLKRGLSRNKVCVLCAIDRSKTIYNNPVGYGKIQKKQILDNLVDRLGEKVVLITDGEKSYKSIADKVKLKQIKAGITKDKVYHLQNVNSYHSGLKDFMRGFKGVATKYLDNYVNFFKAIRSNQDIFDDVLQINNFCRVVDVKMKKIAFA